MCLTNGVSVARNLTVMARVIFAFLTMLSVSVAGAQVVTSRQGHKIMIFGGNDHKTYLGCLSCAESQGDSVLNEFGEHGNPYHSDSLFNPYHEFGSPYSSTSACNPYASDPPVVVDEEGTFYGRLTINEFNSERVRSQAIQTWIAKVCESD
jgi:hypothetical protein